MSTPSDDDLRQRVKQLGQREGAGAPDFRRVLEAFPVDGTPAPWPLRPALALMGAALFAAFVASWPTRPAPVAVASDVAWLVGDPNEVWVLPSDRLLADATGVEGARDVERLSREIEGLLER